MRDIGSVFTQIRVSHIQRHILVDVPTRAKRQDLAVPNRDTHGTVSIGSGRTIEGKACTQGNSRRDLISRTEGERPGVRPVLFFGDSTQTRVQQGRNTLVLDNDFLQLAPAGPRSTGIECPLIVQLVGQGQVSRFRRGEIQAAIVGLIDVDQWAGWNLDGQIGNAGTALELIFNLGAIVKTQRQALSHINQHADVVTVRDVVTAHIYLGIAGRGTRQNVAGELTVDLVDGRTKTNRDTIVELVAQRRLHCDNLNGTLQTVVAALEAALVVADDAEGHVNAQTEMPVIIERGNVVAERHSREGDHVTVVGTRESAAALDVSFCVDDGKTTAYLGAVELRHTCRVAEHCAGVLSRRGTTGKTGSHAARALLVDGKTVSGCVARYRSNSYGKRCFEPVLDHPVLRGTVEGAEINKNFRSALASLR